MKPVFHDVLIIIYGRSKAGKCKVRKFSRREVYWLLTTDNIMNKAVCLSGFMTQPIFEPLNLLKILKIKIPRSLVMNKILYPSAFTTPASERSPIECSDFFVFSAKFGSQGPGNDCDTDGGRIDLGFIKNLVIVQEEKWIKMTM